MNRNLIALYACVLIVMIGFGITLPVLPFYVERLALGSGSTPGRAGFHIGLVTAMYPLTQLVFAPLWGRLSDRIGRRPLVVIGIVGFALTQALFGVATGLGLLYGARIAGGALSSALLPAAAAYVVDLTTAAQRGRGIAWLSTTVGLGTVLGPALGALLLGREIHVRALAGHLDFDGFSVPFVVAALLALVALVAALVTLRDSSAPAAKKQATAGARPDRRLLGRLLGAVLATYLGITIFEATFAVFAVDRYGFGAAKVAAVFAECSLLMILAQVAGASLAGHVGERRLIALGFGAMSAGLVALVASSASAFVFVAVVPLGVGMGFVGPGLTSEVTRHGTTRVGATLGLQQAVQAVGQVTGALLGTLLFYWRASAPYFVAAALLAGVGLAMARRTPTAAH